MTFPTFDGFTVESADYHHNDVYQSEAFYVGLIHEDNDPSSKLITWFPEYDKNGTIEKYQTRIAVLDLAMAAAGNSYMHSENGYEGGNAWRGDRYQAAALAIRECCKEKYRY